MSGVNKAIILGRLGKDPLVRSMNNGSEVVSFSLATSEQWQDKNTGERKEATEWHNVVIFNEGLGGVAKRFLRKGSEVYIEGQLQTRKWTDQSGNDKYATEIVLRQFRGELKLIGGRGDGSNDDQSPVEKQSTSLNGPSVDYDLDDDVPF